MAIINYEHEKLPFSNSPTLAARNLMA